MNQLMSALALETARNELETAANLFFQPEVSKQKIALALMFVIRARMLALVAPVEDPYIQSIHRDFSGDSTYFWHIVHDVLTHGVTRSTGDLMSRYGNIIHILEQYFLQKKSHLAVRPFTNDTLHKPSNQKTLSLADMRQHLSDIENIDLPLIESRLWKESDITTRQNIAIELVHLRGILDRVCATIAESDDYVSDPITDDTVTDFIQYFRSDFRYLWRVVVSTVYLGDCYESRFMIARLRDFTQRLVRFIETREPIDLLSSRRLDIPFVDVFDGESESC